MSTDDFNDSDSAEYAIIRSEFIKIFDDATKKIAELSQAYYRSYPYIDNTVATLSIIWVENILLAIFDAYRNAGVSEQVYKSKQKAIAASFRSTIRRLMDWGEFCDYMNLPEMSEFDKIVDAAAEGDGSDDGEEYFSNTMENIFGVKGEQDKNV